MSYRNMACHLFIFCCVILSCLNGAYAQDTKNQDTLVASINLPFTGPYREQSLEQQKAFQLAIDEINAQGGILGKKIAADFADSLTKAAVAAENAKKAIEEKGAVLIIGGCSSSEAVALADLAKQKQVIYLPGVTNSNAVTGYDIDGKTEQATRQVANRYTFRWFHNAWMTSRALAKYLVDKLGVEKSYYYIVADYTWGYSIEKSMKDALETAGCKTVGSIRIPVGAENYSQALLAVKEQKPDVLVLGLYGKDMINCLRQALSFGVKQNIKIVVPVIESIMAKDAGPEAAEGVIGTMPWYWSLKDKYAGSKEMYDKFYAKYNAVPCANTAVAWTTMFEYADAVKRAGTFNSQAVAKALEGHKFTRLKGEETWRDSDHQGINSVLIVEGKGKNEQANDADVFKVLDEINGDTVSSSRLENPVVWEEKF